MASNAPPPPKGPPPPPSGAPGPTKTISKEEKARQAALRREEERTRFVLKDMTGGPLGRAPFANLGLQVPEYGIAWWFEYFWAEAAMAGDSTEKLKLAEIANLVFEKTPDDRLPYRLRPEFDTVKFTDQNAFHEKWREVLTQLLYLGFRMMERKQVVKPGANLPPIKGLATEHLALARQFYRYIEEKKQGEPRFDDKIEIYYRSETRRIEDILLHKGTRRQIDVDSIAKSMNMTKKWHPFSKPEISNAMWFRRGNADNDYFTVISVAKDFETCLAFPKIDEQRVYHFPQEDVEDWPPNQLDYHRNSLAVVRLMDGTAKPVVATSTTAYMCVAAGAVLDTVQAGGQAGESFPEQGLADIPLDHIFAAFPIRRYHHGHTDPGQGFTAFIDWRNARLLKDLREAMDLYGPAFNRLWEIYMHWKYHAPIATAWSKTGAAQPSVGRKISHVVSDPIDPATLMALKQRRFEAERAKATTEKGKPRDQKTRMFFEEKAKTVEELAAKGGKFNLKHR